jgi:hypothetical protein
VGRRVARESCRNRHLVVIPIEGDSGLRCWAVVRAPRPGSESRASQPRVAPDNEPEGTPRGRHRDKTRGSRHAAELDAGSSAMRGLGGDHHPGGSTSSGRVHSWSPRSSNSLLEGPDRRLASGGTTWWAVSGSTYCRVATSAQPAHRGAVGMTSRRSIRLTRIPVRGRANPAPGAVCADLLRTPRIARRIARSAASRIGPQARVGRARTLATPVYSSSCADSVSEDPWVSAGGMRTRAALPWGLVPFDAHRSRQRPTPGLPHPAVQRLQVFSTS